MCLPDNFSLITKLQDVVYAIYLLIFYKHWDLYVSYANRLFLICSKVLPFFHHVSFLFIAISSIISHSRIWFPSLFFSLGSRSRQCMWLIRFYHFASFHNLLFYHHFTNKKYIFLLIFVISVGNIKSYLTFHTIIIHPTKIFWNKHSVDVMINLHIYFEVFLES